MLEFFKENWLWITFPFVLVLGGLLFLVATDSGEQANGAFIYNLF